MAAPSVCMRMCARRRSGRTGGHTPLDVSFFDDDAGSRRTPRRPPPSRPRARASGPAAPPPPPRSGARASGSSARPATPRTARSGGGGSRGGGSGSRPSPEVRRRQLLAAGVGLLVLVLLIVGVKSCSDSSRENGLRDYNRQISALVQNSDTDVSPPLFRLLSR